MINVDELMKLICNGFILIENHRIVTAVLLKVGIESLVHILQDWCDNKLASKQQAIANLTATNYKVWRIYGKYPNKSPKITASRLIKVLIPVMGCTAES